MRRVPELSVKSERSLCCRQKRVGTTSPDESSQNNIMMTSHSFDNRDIFSELIDEPIPVAELADFLDRHPDALASIAVGRQFRTHPREDTAIPQDGKQFADHSRWR